MRLKRLGEDTLIRFEDGIKRSVKTGEIVVVEDIARVEFFKRNGFIEVETEIETKEVEKVQPKKKK